MSFVKKYYPTLVILAVVLCSFYSLGIFDIYFIEDVSEKKYELGDFSYTGKLKDGKFEDTGVIYLEDGAKFFGQFRNGNFSGNFVYVNKDMLSFYGTFTDDTIVDGIYSNEKGKAVIKNDNKVNYKSFENWSYEGDFNINGQCNMGTFIYPNGNKYEGEFLNGLANNNGTYYTSGDEVIYSGNFQNGLLFKK